MPCNYFARLKFQNGHTDSRGSYSVNKVRSNAWALKESSVGKRKKRKGEWESVCNEKTKRYCLVKMIKLTNKCLCCSTQHLCEFCGCSYHNAEKICMEHIDDNLKIVEYIHTSLFIRNFSINLNEP